VRYVGPSGGRGGAGWMGVDLSDSCHSDGVTVGSARKKCVSLFELLSFFARIALSGRTKSAGAVVRW
jgi:hypothetical protein